MKTNILSAFLLMFAMTIPTTLPALADSTIGGGSFPVIVNVSTTSSPAVTEATLQARIVNAQTELNRAKKELASAKGAVLKAHGFAETDDYEFNEHPDMRQELAKFENQLNVAKLQVESAKQAAESAYQNALAQYWFWTQQ